MTFTFLDYRGIEIQLTAQVYQVVLLKHPESAQFFDRIGEILAQPDLVKASQTDSRVDLYYRFYADVLNGKFVVVVV